MFYSETECPLYALLFISDSPTRYSKTKEQICASIQAHAFVQEAIKYIVFKLLFVCFVLCFYKI